MLAKKSETVTQEAHGSGLEEVAWMCGYEPSVGWSSATHSPRRFISTLHSTATDTSPERDTPAKVAPATPPQALDDPIVTRTRQSSSSSVSNGVSCASLRATYALLAAL